MPAMLLEDISPGGDMGRLVASGPSEGVTCTEKKKKCGNMYLLYL